MADQFGALALPVPVPGSTDVIADRFLQYALSYFQAFINAKAAAAWAARVPAAASSPPVKTTHPHDPAELSFVERELPALYMWRGEQDQDDVFQMAEDILACHEKVHVLWIMPPADEEKQKKRVQFLNAIHKSLTVSFQLGRDPSWVVPGDTDPQAATYGSVFPRWAGWSNLRMSSWKQKIFILENPDSKERYAFHAFEALLSLEEIFDEDLAKYDLLDGVDQTLTTGDGQVVTDHALFQ